MAQNRTCPTVAAGMLVLVLSSGMAAGAEIVAENISGDRRATTATKV